MSQRGIFGVEFQKKNYHILNQHSQICLIAKFCEKTKMPYLDVFWVEFENCHILKQLPRICLTAKFCQIMKMAKFGTKNDLFGYF